jgi:hypothetical protein
MTIVPESLRSLLPVWGTTALRGFIMQAESVSSADDGVWRDGAKPSTSTTPTAGASQSASSAQPRKKAKASNN